MDLFKNQTWKFVKHLSETHPLGEVFVVGGAVRDSLIKREIKDFDFVIRNIPLEELIESLKPLGGVDLVGKRFGVIKFRPEGTREQYDIALPRKEFSWAFTGAYRDFKVQSDHELPIEQDLARRDFTINAMAYNVITHELVDPFFGQKDLKSKTIRSVGSAVTRFQEDYSRMMRALRFACQLDFTLSKKTHSTIQKMVGHLHDQVNDEWVVAREVVSQEFLKGFEATPIKCLNLMDELNLLETIFPEIKRLQQCPQSPPYHNEGNAFNHIIAALKSIESDKFKSYFPNKIPLLSKLGILFHDLGKPDVTSKDKKGGIHFYGHAKAGAEATSKICKRQKLGATSYSSFKCEFLVWIVKHHLFSIDSLHEEPTLITLEKLFFSDKYPSESLLHTMLADQLGSYSDKNINSIEPFEKLMKKLNELAPDKKLPEPWLSGQDVLDLLDIQPGPVIQIILDDLREQQLNRTINSTNEAKEFIKNHKHD